MRFWLTTLSLLALLAVQQPVLAGNPTKKTFDQGRERYLQGQFDQAIASLSPVAASQHKLASRALLIQGKAELGRKNWGAARAVFERLVKNHPTSKEADKARYKLAEILEFTGEAQAALKRYREIAASQSIMRAEAGARVGVLETR